MYLEDLVKTRIKRIELLRDQERNSHFRILEGIMLGMEQSTLIIITKSFDPNMKINKDIVNYRGTDAAYLAMMGFREHSAILELNTLYYDAIRPNGIKAGYVLTPFYVE